MKKTCVYCGKEFEVNPVGCGGNTRLFCYDCFPEGMTREDITALKRLLLIDLVSKLKIERGCDICGYNESAWALEWHHVNPETKSGQLSVMLTDMKWETYLNEIEKCVLLCANCHREVHELERAQRNKYLCYVDKQVKKRKSKQKKNNNKQANMKHNVYRPSQLIPPLLTDDDIYALYNLKNHSIKQVAKIIGCDPMTIASVINKFPDIKQYKQASGKIIMIDRQTNLPHRQICLLTCSTQLLMPLSFCRKPHINVIRFAMSATESARVPMDTSGNGTRQFLRNHQKINNVKVAT